MQTLRVSNLISGDQPAVYEYVTAFPTQGEPDTKTMEQKYGQFLGRENNTYTFLENIGGGTKWECVFDPPARRIMRAPGTKWSDRTDWFEVVEGGTLWTIHWQLKSQSPAAYIQAIMFHLRGHGAEIRAVPWPRKQHLQFPGKHRRRAQVGVRI